MVEVGAFHQSGGPICDRRQLLDASLSLPALNEQEDRNFVGIAYL
jgi:hypothetical protein